MNKNFIFGFFAGLSVLVVFMVLGIYRFNLTNDDIYVETETGEVVKYDDHIKHEKSGEQEYSIIAENLTIPWDVAFLSDGEILITERPGNVKSIKDGVTRDITLQDVSSVGEGGLMGMVLHPEFEKNRWVYLYISRIGGLTTRFNGVERYKYVDGLLTEKKKIVSNIPGAIYHDGGRIEFGPDGYLYITTGDVTKPRLSQDKNSTAGKILRVDDEGNVPDDNPFNTMVYSFGHRNPQGIAWDSDGVLWSTEHGRSGVRSGFDEVNIIKKGGNYGWPKFQGDEKHERFIAPILHSGDDTWAPASIAIYEGRILFGGLRGEALYELIKTERGDWKAKEHFKGVFGRIRTVIVSPDGKLYITTSNTDGRGQKGEKDDLLIQINW